MSSILFGYTMSLTTAATPSTGYLVAYDVDNILKQKDQFGVITQIGSTALGGGINFTTGDGLTFSGSTLSVWVDNSTIQINGLGELEAINFGPLSGSDNYVPYYTSSTTLSSTSSIYVTGSNVGIGTITPSAKLHIVGTSSVVNGLLDSSNISLLISNSSGQQSLIVKNDRSVSVNGSAWPYLSYTSSILTISGRTSDSSEYATIWTDSNSNYLAFFRNDGIFSFSRPGTGISKVGINVLPSFVVNDLQVSGTGSFYSVGVGTTTPSYPLHVIGTVSSDTGYNIGATAGFTGTGNYTNFTIIGGIIVSAS
jgi:hypothetical protein